MTPAQNGQRVLAQLGIIQRAEDEARDHVHHVAVERFLGASSEPCATCQLARAHHARLASLDQGLAALHGEGVLVVPND